MKSKVLSLIYEALTSPGQELDPAVRTFYECCFHHNFSDVRVHIDACAAKSASAINALAFTIGNHIFFGEYRYNPLTPDGKLLLAHELVHIMQQPKTTTISLDYLRFGEPHDTFEDLATRYTHAITEGIFPPYYNYLSIINREYKGPVLRGWWIEKDLPSHLRHLKDIGQTHEGLTRCVLKEPEFTKWFNVEWKNLLIEGVAQPDINKVNELNKCNNNKKCVDKVNDRLAPNYHCWSRNGPINCDRQIDFFIQLAVISSNVRSYNLKYELKEHLGNALHLAQDSAAHQTPCSIEPTHYGLPAYFKNVLCNSEEQDTPSINVVGWRIAFEKTREVLRKFYKQLNYRSRINLLQPPK
jgi:hypothetical protein